jgi:hypothetical protein
MVKIHLINEENKDAEISFDENEMNQTSRTTLSINKVIGSEAILANEEV